MKEEYTADLATQNNILQKLNFALKDNIADLKSQVTIVQKVKSDLKSRYLHHTEKSSILAIKIQEINKLLQAEDTKPTVALKSIPRDTAYFQKTREYIPLRTRMLCVDPNKTESEHRDSEPPSLVQVAVEPQVEGSTHV